MPRSEAYRPRKRAKTFTGCWTCRERKVKCDETRPACRQCQRKSLSCEGYGARLQWLTPITASTLVGDTDDFLEGEALPAIHNPLRRSVPHEHRRDILSSSEVDRILRQIDTVRSNQLSADGVTGSKIEDFSVLDLTLNSGTPASVPSQANVVRSLDTSANCTDGDVGESADDTGISSSAFESQIAQDRAHAQPVLISSSRLNSAEVAHANHSFLAHGLEGSHSLPLQDDLDTPIPRRSENDADSSTHLSPLCLLQADDWLRIDGLPGEALQSFELDCFLLRHYKDRVCHIFCMIDSPKSPWKTIHLPKALQSMGELSVTGQTSNVRRALLSALLSVSGWYLSNDHRRHQHLELAEQWARVATNYGTNTIALLKRAVEKDLYRTPRPKYKEYLATMLSMITINVMCGDTSTCDVHLDGAGQLIRSMWLKKPKFSEKARALHRIYCYLRIIWTSTIVKRCDEPPFTQTNNSLPDSNNFYESVFHRVDGPTSAERSSGQMPSLDETTETASFECIYGIPQSLLALLEDTINLMNRVDRAREVCGSTHLPEALSSSCDELERTILDWQGSDERTPNIPSSGQDVRGDLIDHQTRSFHSALIIFFSQNIRLLDHRYLRHYVEGILQSIEAIERLKASINVLAAPLFWPAFIAASEAFDPELQSRFRKWYEEMEAYGIAGMRTGIRVIHEVWEKGPSRGKRYTSKWREVVARNRDSLMLS